MEQKLLFYLILLNSEFLGKWFVDTLGKRFCVKFLGYAHWFMSIRISHIKDHSISVDQARYDTSILEKYLDNATVKTSTNFYNTTLPYDMIFAKADAYTSYDQFDKLTREFNIYYRYCIGIVPAQDFHFFYTRSRLSALQSCALFFSTNF